MQEKARHWSFPQKNGETKPPIQRSKMPPVPEPPLATSSNKDSPIDPYDELTREDADLQPGQVFQMDFGFVRGSGYSTTDAEGRRVTSIDGMNSYLLIIDRKTRRLWVFLMKSKAPPLQLVKDFLAQNGSRTTTHHIICTDQGGELWGSEAFQQTALKCQYLVEPTGTGAPEQKGHC